MPHQRSRRLGWQSQNLARFLLYKFSFLAEPVQIADDIGIDFFCTLFETKWNENNAELIPRNSFAIQIKSKSKSNKIDLTSYLPYLQNLELPFFIGVVDRSTLTMTVFSGECLILFFVYKGLPDHLEAELCERSRITDPFGWWAETSPGKYTLLFPSVTKIAANTSDEQLDTKVNEIREICSKMLDNIAANINKQFLLKGPTPYQLLFAGPESLRRVEDNLFSRLTEVFFNLNWAYSNSVEGIKPQIERGFRLYENVYLQLASFYGEDALPGLLRDTFKGTKNRIGSPHDQNETKDSL